MIDGFRIEMTSDELIQHLETRIQHHRRAATECERKRIRFEAVGNLDEEDDSEMPLLAAWPGYRIEIERRVDGHKRKETTLTFLRDHVIAREIYRLGEDDLRLLELWPRRASFDTEG